ncbi:MAG: hypothetical protein ACYDDQ_01990 [Vulcanimicrobiaceae bacterium]
MLEWMADLGTAALSIAVMGVGIVMLATWLSAPSPALKWARAAVGAVGVFFALFGVMSLTLNILDAPNWRHEAVTYCLGHGGVRLALTGTFGGTDAVVCGDGTTEDYEGSYRRVRVRPFRW